MKPVEGMSREEALKRLKGYEREGKIDSTGHFRDQLGARGVDFFDVRMVIRSGSIYQEPELDQTHGEWKYTVIGRYGSGALLKIVFSFKPWGQARLITVIWD